MFPPSSAVDDFAPTILELYMTTSTRDKRFNPVLLTTGNILSESQLNFVLKEIENQRPVSEQGSKEDILTEIILPELIMYLFRQKFDFSIEQALTALNDQEEYNLLNLEDELEAELPKKRTKVLTSSNKQPAKRAALPYSEVPEKKRRGRPKKVAM